MLDSIVNFFNAWPDWLRCLLQLAVGFTLLLAGGNWLVHGAVTIARRLGVPVLLIGLTIVAAGTSSPELAFNLFATINGNGEMCFGNVIGSNIANIGLVLGICAMTRPLQVNSVVVKRELPWLVGISVLMFGMAIAPTSGLRTGEAPSRGYGFVDGILFLVGFILVLIVWYRQARSDARDPLVKEVQETAEAETLRSLTAAWLVFFLGLAALLLGGNITKEGAVTAAEIAGLSEAVIGLSIVAIATSLPEVMASWVAVRKGHTDLAVGNVVGSNLFNILLVLGTTSVCAPVPLPGIFGWYDLTAMLVLTVAIIPIARFGNQKNTVNRVEGLLLLAFYGLYIAFAVIREYFGWADDLERWFASLFSGG